MDDSLICITLEIIHRDNKFWIIILDQQEVPEFPLNRLVISQQVSALDISPPPPLSFTNKIDLFIGGFSLHDQQDPYHS